MPAYAPLFYSGASAGGVEGISKKSNFIKGLKLIEDYMQVGRY